MPFPKNFTWGAATASYQIEGAASADGRGLSVWDIFCRKPDKVWNKHSGTVACDHYHRWPEDLDLMRSIGLQAYRFSIAWPRILPDGTGRVEKRGLDFYDRLVDGMLARGIQPWATLFHWDYPYALYSRGGWLNPDSPSWFADYTQVVVERLSDRVKHWMTLNEPQCFVGLGHRLGWHAPGDQLMFPQTMAMSRNVLLAHGLAVQVIRAHTKQSAHIGFAPVGTLRLPATESPADIEAARADTFCLHPNTEWNSAWWMDPVFLGRMPEDAATVLGDAMPEMTDADLRTVHQPLDFFGANIYTATRVRAGADGKPEVVPHPVGHPVNTYSWAITPDVLYWAGKFFHERYRLPIVVTENGVPVSDLVFRDGAVHDPQRIEFLETYLGGVRRAIDEGVPFSAYFYWSLMDNFEWQEGYKHRFGLVYVDYTTQRRILKDSAHRYREIIQTNGAEL